MKIKYYIEVTKEQSELYEKLIRQLYNHHKSLANGASKASTAYNLQLASDLNKLLQDK